jgi:hypothetical protein
MVKLDDLTDEAIGRFRWNLPDSEWSLKHDCLVAKGGKRSPHKGGKLEARQRVCDAMNAQLVTIAKLGKAVAAVVVPSGNKDSTGTSCQCGHAVEEHGNNQEFPGSTECSECADGECIAYEATDE